MDDTREERKVKRIGRYSIASADMYMSEMGQREVCVYDDPEQGLRVWGELPAGSGTGVVDLCQIFLEYALYCQTARREDQAYNEMREFADHLGSMLAEYLRGSSLLSDAADPGACGA